MKTKISHLAAALTTGFFALQMAAPALADRPTPWELTFQPSASPSDDHILWLHNAVLMPVITGIVLLVMALLLLVVILFNHRANPVARPTPHNPVLEVAWTVIPALILLAILIPSWRLIFYTDRTVHPEMTLKVTGYQWYWGYEYPSQGGINFLSNRIPDKELKPGQIRMLSVDNPAYLPVNTNVQILITGSDVIHGFAVPSFGVQMDAVPGRINETWVNIKKPGIYYGECTQLCGANHSFMPIEIHAVSKADFAKWVEDQKKQASNDNAPVTKVAAQ